MDYGFRAIISPSFGDIFKNNSFKNGLLLIELSASETARLITLIQKIRGMPWISIWRPRRSPTRHARFDIDPFHRVLWNGWDDINLTLKGKKKSAIMKRDTPPAGEPPSEGFDGFSRPRRGGTYYEGESIRCPMIIRQRPRPPSAGISAKRDGEVYESLKVVLDQEPTYRRAKIFEHLLEPERVIIFRVPWQDDQGEISSPPGSACSGVRPSARIRAAAASHPSVNLSIMKFLAFEQTFKNA